MVSPEISVTSLFVSCNFSVTDTCQRMINEAEDFTLKPFKDFGPGDVCVTQGGWFTETNITEGRLVLLCVCLCYMFMTVSRQMNDHKLIPS